MFSMLSKRVSRQVLGTAKQRPAGRARLRVEELECRLTPSAPGALSLTATPVSAGQINLAWSGGSGANGYYVDEWTASGWTTIANLASSSSFYGATGLNANTTYYFDVGAYNTSGVTWASSWVSATTYAAPPATFSFTANAYSASQINLAWSSVGAANGYYIDQWTSSGWTQIATLGAGSTSYAATGLVANTTYYFDVGASNAYGTTWASNWQSAKTGVFVDHPLQQQGLVYQPAGGSLFGAGGPSYLDVQQGAAGDCWLMASLAEVAARNPSDIQSMFSYAGTTVENGTTVSLYSVRFFNASGNPVYVTVDTELPNGGGWYARDNGVLWVALAEKAYAQANGEGLVTTQNYGQDTYAALNGGYPTWALQAITGKSAGYYSIDPTNIAAAWNAGQLIVLATGTPASPYIVGNHCYAVVGYNASSSMPFEMYNPWGTNSSGWSLGTENGQAVYGLFTANAAFVSQNFADQAIATGSAAQTDTVSRVFATDLTGNKAPMIETTSTTNENLVPNLVSGNTTSPATTSLPDKLALAGFEKKALDALWVQAGSTEMSLNLLNL
jgi:hypothetical protein